MLTRKTKNKLDTRLLFLNLKSKNITRNKKMAGKDSIEEIVKEEIIIEDKKEVTREVVSEEIEETEEVDISVKSEMMTTTKEDLIVKDQDTQKLMMMR